MNYGRISTNGRSLVIIIIIIIIIKMETIKSRSIRINWNLDLDVLVFAHDVISLCRFRRLKQSPAFQLQGISNEFNMATAIVKRNIVAFYGKHPIRSNIRMYNELNEQVNSYEY